ncbi:MAG: CpaF family protein, partial [Planctomycetota bacterium]|nr:CpaF family protein [Planctomycetota bacterium]
SQDDKGKLIDELADEVFGLGPIEPLLSDPSVSDILVNGAEEVFVERQGRLEKTDIVFADNAHVMRIIQRVVSKVGRRVDEASPMVDARLPDGSRINAVIPPLALDGPKLSIRRFATDRLQLPQLQENGSLNAPIVEFLSACVAARIGVLISGGTGAGKTTLLNALSSAIPADERIVTIEDSAELSMNHPHVVKLETRDSNTEGSGEISQRDLVRNSLRMRPDRIIVGEVRGAESLDMLQAMNTGHEGSMTTIHANDTPDALKRLEMMVAMTGFELPIPVVRQYVAAGIRLVVHLSRLKGGVRRVMQVCEIVDADHGEYKLESVFGFRQQGLDEDGVAKGHFFTTGWTPSFIERFEDYGVQLSQDLFKAM